MSKSQRNLTAIRNLYKAGASSGRLLGLLLNVVIVIIVLLLGGSTWAVTLKHTQAR